MQNDTPTIAKSPQARNVKARTIMEPAPVDGARWLALTRGQFALVDEEDFDWLSAWYWTALIRPGRSPYAFRKVNGKPVYLHRFIMGDPPEMDVDHKDGNGLNCRRDNLRVCTHARNQQNYSKCSTVTSSSFKGVTWDKNRRKWMARIKVNRKFSNLGRFENEQDAACAYDEAANQLFGEFARLNFP